MLKPSSALNISPMMWPIEPWPPEPNGTTLFWPLIHGDQLRHGLGRHGRTHHESVGDGADIGHVREVLQRIVGRLVEQEGRDRQRRAVRQHQRVVVLGLQHGIGADRRAAARLVVDHHGLAELFPTAGRRSRAPRHRTRRPAGRSRRSSPAGLAIAAPARCRRWPVPSRMPKPVCVRSWKPPELRVSSRNRHAAPQAPPRKSDRPHGVILSGR